MKRKHNLLGIDPRAARSTWTAALILLLIGVIYLIREALFVFVIALLFAYLLYPLMDLIDKRLTSKTRTPALAMTFILVLGVIIALAIPASSVVATEAENLAQQAPGLLDRLRQNPPSAAPATTGVKSIESQIFALLQSQIQQHYGDLATLVPKMAVKVLSASQNLIFIVIIPILSFLILRDGRSIRDRFLEMLDSGRDEAKETLADAHELLLLYMRALLFLCCATLISFSIAFSIMGVPYALLLASIAFPLEFIPFVGPMSAAAIIIVVCIVSGYAHVWWVVIFLGIYRLLEDYGLSPMLMSKGVELHPLLVIFGVMAGGELAGVAGAFLSIPVIALFRLLYHRMNAVRKKRQLRVRPDRANQLA
jgi:predicted PurR-regulated permease PerM